MKKDASSFFKSWFKIDKEGHEAFDAFVDQLKEEQISDDLELLDAIDTDAAYDKVLRRLEPKVVRPIFQIRKLMRYAAIFIVVIGGFYALKSKFFSQKIPTNRNHIVLTMENESSAILTSELRVIRDEHGNAIAKGSVNELTYSKNQYSFAKHKRLHVLKIPKGKTFTVTLSDGTKIHCDADTELKYAINKDGTTGRDVYLKGQAYFEVTHNKKKPFTVHTHSMDVKVLGTRFNVSAYPEDTTKTVLVDGSVLAMTAQHTDSLLLKPNQMAFVKRAGSSLSKTNVDASEFIAWRKGKLIFNKVPFNTILKSFERKYGVVIRNSNATLGQQLFTARFETETIDQAIRAFQAEAGFDYDVTPNGIEIK